MSHDMHDKAADALFAYEEELNSWVVMRQIPGQVQVVRYGRAGDQSPGDVSTSYVESVEAEWLTEEQHQPFLKLKAMSAALRAVGVE